MFGPNGNANWISVTTSITCFVDVVHVAIAKVVPARLRSGYLLGLLEYWMVFGSKKPAGISSSSD